MFANFKGQTGLDGMFAYSSINCVRHMLQDDSNLERNCLIHKPDYVRKHRNDRGSNRSKINIAKCRMSDYIVLLSVTMK